MKLNVIATLLFVADALEHVQHSSKFLGKDHVEHVATAHDGVPPVSTTMKCVINLTVQFFLLYTAVQIMRTYHEIVKTSAKDVEKDTTMTALKFGCVTMNYAPMLCVLFVGVRMRALQLTQGDPDSYNLPQPYVKNSMQACAWSVLVQTLMVLAMPFVGGSMKKNEETGEVVFAMEGAAGKVCTGVRYLAMLALYGGFTAVCVGGCTMEAPAALYPSGTPPVSPAVACTMNLCFQYFGVYLAIAIIQTYKDVAGKKLEGVLATVDATLSFCKATVVFAPMLCILFIGARMRALQMDPVNGNPQKWAQNCFYLCTYAVLAQLVLLFIIPAACKCELEAGTCEGDVSFKKKAGETNDTVFSAIMGLRFVIMLSLYGGFSAVIYSVMVIEAPNGATTPPVSPAMQCVMNLTMQFFFVYLMLWILITAKSFDGEARKEFYAQYLAIFDTATKTVFYCPMLCVLFVGMRMRALQITNQKGAPQGFAQQGMFCATWSVLVQLCMIIVWGVMWGAPKTDESGNVVEDEAAEGGKKKAEGMGIGGYITLAIRYLALLALYGGAGAVVYALFVITPETANGQGALIPGVEVPAPAGA